MPQYAPPGGVYFFEVPETGRFFSHADLVELERQIVAHLEASGAHVPPNLRALIEHYMCQRLPQGACEGEGVFLPGQRQPNYFEVLNALPRTLHGPWATPAEAERRATACRSCPRNNLSLCTHCNDLQEQALAHIGGRQVLQLAFLGVCTQVMAPAYALVWVRDAEVPGGPTLCWAAHHKEESKAS